MRVGDREQRSCEGVGHKYECEWFDGLFPAYSDHIYGLGGSFLLALLASFGCSDFLGRKYHFLTSFPSRCVGLTRLTDLVSFMGLRGGFRETTLAMGLSILNWTNRLDWFESLDYMKFVHYIIVFKLQIMGLRGGLLSDTHFRRKPDPLFQNKITSFNQPSFITLYPFLRKPNPLF